MAIRTLCDAKHRASRWDAKKTDCHTSFLDWFAMTYGDILKEIQLFLPVKLRRQAVRQFHQRVVPLAGVVHPHDGRA